MSELSARQIIAELRAITTALRLGGLNTLRRAEITRTDAGVRLTLHTGAGDTRKPEDTSHADR